MIQLTNESLKQLLVGAVDDTEGNEGFLDGAKVLAYTNEVTLSSDTIFSELTPAARVETNPSAAITWGTPFSDQDGGYQVVGSAVTFTCDTPEDGEIVRGYGVFTGSSPNEVLLWAENFAEPVIISQEGDGFTVVVSIEMQGGETYGSGVLIS